VPEGLNGHTEPMHPWMLTAPQATLPGSATTAFQAAWDARDPALLLPPETPRWLFLRWLQGLGVLFHGSPQAGLTEFEPRTPHDLSADDVRACSPPPTRCGP